MNDKQFDHIISDRLRNHSTSVDPAIWQNVSAAINTGAKRRRRMLWLVWSAVGVALIGLAGYWVISQPGQAASSSNLSEKAYETTVQSTQVTSPKLNNVQKMAVVPVDGNATRETKEIINNETSPVQSGSIEKQDNPSYLRESASAVAESEESQMSFSSGMDVEADSYFTKGTEDENTDAGYDHNVTTVKPEIGSPTTPPIENSPTGGNTLEENAYHASQMSQGLSEDGVDSDAASPWKDRILRETALLTHPLDDEGSEINRLKIDYDACRVQTNTECYSFTPKISHYYIDFLMGPAYHFSELHAKNRESDAYQRLREDTESYLFAFTAEARATMVWQSGVTLSAGLSYTQLSEKFDYFNPDAQQTILNVIPVDTIYGPPPNNDVTYVWDTLSIEYIGERTVVHHNKYRFLDVPLTVGYELESEKFILSINAGVMFNLAFTQRGRILSPNEEVVYLQDGKDKSYDGYKSNAGVSLIGGLGIAYKLQPDLHLLVEPHMRYTIKSLEVGANPIEHRMSLVGLRFGIRKLL